MRPLFLTLLLVCPLLGQNSQEDSQKRIRQLEERLQLVEAQLAILMAERAAPLPPIETAASPAAATVSKPARERFETPPELIPEIGKIGAEVGVLVSGSASPFKLNSGAFYGGFIDLPLVDRPTWLHGKISYEIMVGLSRSRTQVQSTSNVAQVANLAVLTAVNPNGPNNISDALTGTGAAPFPVTTTNQANLRLLQVVPFALKYTSTAFDRWRFRPYALAGFGTYVTIHSETPLGSGLRSDANLPAGVLAALSQSFSGQAPFGGPLVAGQIGQASQLVARGLPGGNGNIDIGLQTGGGFEFRLTRTLSFGFDGRFNKISGSNASFGTYGSRIGIHF